MTGSNQDIYEIIMQQLGVPHDRLNNLLQGEIPGKDERTVQLARISGKYQERNTEDLAQIVNQIQQIIMEFADTCEAEEKEAGSSKRQKRNNN